MLSRRLLAIRGIAGILASTLIAATFIPRVWDAYVSEWSDQGNRLLVIIQTEGGSTNYGVYLPSHISDSTGDLIFSMYIQSPKRKAEGEQRPVSEIDIYFVGDNIKDKIACGSGHNTQPQPVQYEQLPPSVRHAYDADVIAEGASATNYHESTVANSPSDTPEPHPSTTEPQEASHSAVDFLQYRAGTMWGWFNDEHPSRRYAENENGSVFVDECKVDHSLIWASSSRDHPMNAPRATLFVPEFDVVSGTPHPTDLGMTLWLPRIDALEVAASYPPLECLARGWRLQYDGHPVNLRDKGRIWLYSEAPTFLVSNRNSTRKEQSYLFYGGIFLSFSISLALQAARDLCAAHFREKGRTDN